MRHSLKVAALSTLAMAVALSPSAADGIVAKVVNSPLNSAGLVKEGYTALNVYLQKPEAEGNELFNPEIPGFGIPAGSHIEVEMGGDFARAPAVAMDTGAVHMVSGTPQHGLSSKGLGYQSVEGENPNIFVVSAISPEGLPAEKLLPRATVEKLDRCPISASKCFISG